MQTQTNALMINVILTDHTSMSVCITKDLHKTGFIVAYVYFCISMASVVSV